LKRVKIKLKRVYKNIKKRKKERKNLNAIRFNNGCRRRRG
jgi:hypothetical protein